MLFVAKRLDMAGHFAHENKHKNSTFSRAPHALLVGEKKYLLAISYIRSSLLHILFFLLPGYDGYPKHLFRTKHNPMIPDCSHMCCYTNYCWWLSLYNYLHIIHVYISIYIYMCVSLCIYILPLISNNAKTLSLRKPLFHHHWTSFAWLGCPFMFGCHRGFRLHSRFRTFIYIYTHTYIICIQIHKHIHAVCVYIYN